METISKNTEHCHICGEGRHEYLYNRGGKKVCSLCIKVILDIVIDYVKNK